MMMISWIFYYFFPEREDELPTKEMHGSYFTVL